MQVGSIILYPKSIVPDGFLVCDGSAVSRDLYSALFNVIGVTYGSGDGSTTFNLPDFSGRVPVGLSVGYNIGATGGETSHVLASTEIAAHTHAISGHTHSSGITATTPELTHTVGQPTYNYTKLTGGASKGGGQSTTYGFYNGIRSSYMMRTTDLAVNDHTAAACTVSGGLTDCPAFDTELAGTSQPHDNMMPYLTLTYLIYSPEKIYQPGMVYFNGAMVVGPSGCYFTGKGV